ncbi:MAG: hypothetical protein ABI925_12845, partial [Verrucomicrobiota bacterium]
GPKVWCCIDGRVGQSTEAECRAKGGQTYRSEKEARARCGGGANGGGDDKTCWACVNGKVVQLTKARARGMQCFASREEAQSNCRPKEKEKEKETNCWTCISGRVGQMAESKARARGLPCFSSREEAARSCSGGGGKTPDKPTKKRTRRG